MRLALRIGKHWPQGSLKCLSIAAVQDSPPSFALKALRCAANVAAALQANGWHAAFRGWQAGGTSMKTPPLWSSALKRLRIFWLVRRGHNGVRFCVELAPGRRYSTRD